jgi:hypothetical protein
MTTKRPVGRPPSGLPKRVRRNLNIERTAEFDADLLYLRTVLAEARGVPVERVSQTDIIRASVKYYKMMRSHS